MVKPVLLWGEKGAGAGLTFRPRIWLMAALSFRVHSATTLALISFIYNMKAFRGFFTCGFFSSSFFTVTGDFLGRHTAVGQQGQSAVPLGKSCLALGPSEHGRS